MHISRMLKPHEERNYLDLNAESPHVVYLTDNAILHQYLMKNNKMVYTTIKLECIESIAIVENKEQNYADMYIRTYSGDELAGIRFAGSDYKKVTERAVTNIRIKMA